LTATPCCNTLQHSATYYRTPHTLPASAANITGSNVGVYCNTLQHTAATHCATHCHTLLHTAATHCNTLNTLQHTPLLVSLCRHHDQVTAPHYNTLLQHNATHYCTLLYHIATHSKTPHTLPASDAIITRSKVRICCNICTTLQHTAATHCNALLQHTATHRNTLQHTATHCNTLQQTSCLTSPRPHHNRV